MPLMTTLAQRLTGIGTWPPPDLAEVWEEIELFSAFRSSDETRIRQEASINWRDGYLLSPVPRMISRASTNLLFGAPPVFTAAAERDQENLERIVEDNMLWAELQRAGLVCSSEGEVWGKLSVQPDVLDVPIVEFVSRGRVIPHFKGRFVLGASFLTEWEESAMEVVRLIETYEAGLVSARLYRGSRTTLGTEVALDSYEKTKDHPKQTATGIDKPLICYIPNSVDADPTRGYADYQGLRDRFLALNEAVTVGQENLRLAGKKRALVDAGYADEDGQLDSNDDIFLRHPKHGGDDAPTAKPLEVIDYDFDATQVIAWLDHLLDSTLSFAGVAPETVGRQVQGGAISGTALKLKQSHSLVEAAGKGRFFDAGVGWLLRAAQVIDSRRTTEGGFGRNYADADSQPAIERKDAMPRDDIEAAQYLTALTSAEAISLEQKILFAHPDWAQEQVDDELERLREELKAQDSLGFGQDPFVPTT